MKITLLSLLTVICIEATAQTIITNGGFEQWTVGHPDNWTSPDFLDITQTTDKNSGIYAAKLEDVTGGGQPCYMTTTSAIGVGEHPTYASCYFKFGGNVTDEDYAIITISLIDSSLQEVIVATQELTSNFTSYTPVTISFGTYTYTYIPNPTKIKIDVEFVYDFIGSQFFVDDFGYEANTATGVVNSTTFKSDLNIFPNPNDGHFKIKSTNNDKMTSIKVVNMLGETIYTVDKPQPFTEENIDLSSIPKGVYFVVAQTDSKSYMEKVIVK